MLCVTVCAADVAGVGEGIRQLSVGGGGDAALRGRDSQRRGALRYVGPDTRPEHVTNKQGDVRATAVITLMLLTVNCFAACMTCDDALMLNMQLPACSAMHRKT